MLTASTTNGNMANGETRRSASDSLISIGICLALVVITPFVFMLLLRVLIVGAPIALIGGILIFIASYFEGRD